MGIRKSYPYLILLGIIYLCIRFFCAQELCASEIQKERIQGADRYQTAVMISQREWTSSDYAVLVRGDDFADGLCAGPLAYKYSAPILLTDHGKLSQEVLAELKRLSVKHLIIIGGFGAVEKSVEDTLRQEGIVSVERIYGENRYQTSVRVAERLDAEEAVLIAGEGYADALSIITAASVKGMPILFTGKEKIPPEIEQYLEQKRITNTYIIGGTGIISPNLEDRISGAVRLGGRDRYQTNAMVLSYFRDILDFNDIYLTRGNGELACALTGGVLAARTASPLVLVGKGNPINMLTDSLSALTAGLDNNIRIIGLGNEEEVPESVLESIVSQIAGFDNGQESGDKSGEKDGTGRNESDEGDSDREEPGGDDLDGDHSDSGGDDSDPDGSDSGGSPVAENRVKSVSLYGLEDDEVYYKEGDIVVIEVEFEENVEVTGTPALELNLADGDREAIYSGGSGAAVITFDYIVQPGDFCPQLDYSSADSLRLNGGEIKTVGTDRDAILTLPSPGDAGSLGESRKIIIDGIPPEAIDISAQNTISPRGMLTLSVTGGPLADASWQDILKQITDNTEQGDNWITGIACDSLIIEPSEDGVTAVLRNIGDSEGIITQDFRIPAELVVDRAGNVAPEEINIDSHAVVVTEVASDNADGYYKDGDIILIEIHFSGDVEVTGTPLLQLETGETVCQAHYLAGSGTPVLTFSYTVQEGDNCLVLDYLSADALDLNDGSIRMAASDEDVSLTLPVPGEKGSLGFEREIVVDTNAPSAIYISSQDILGYEEDGYVTLTAIGGPLSDTSWLSILDEIESHIARDYWIIGGITRYDLALTIAEDGNSAILENHSDKDGLIVKDFIISAPNVVDRAGNAALENIRIDSYSGD